MKACVFITSNFGQNVKNYFRKKYYFVLGYKMNIKKRLLNDQVRSITHEVDVLELTYEGPLLGTDKNEQDLQSCCVN